MPDTSLSALVIIHFDIDDTQDHRFLTQSFVLNKPAWQWALTGASSTTSEMIQEGPLVRAGRKSTMAEQMKQKGRLPKRYLLPMDNAQVKAEVKRQPTDGGQTVEFTLTPDTADVFRAEMGLACLLDSSIDRVQWVGQGPFASYPGRHQACRYGLWAKHKDDLYFEGNHGGVDAAILTDDKGNGLLIVGDSLDLNFEQTDRGIVLTVNAAVSGQGPKFARTAFNAWEPEKGPIGEQFRVYGIKAGEWPATVRRLFDSPEKVPVPFRPFLTQYDTYLLRYADIVERYQQ
jgi:beta-galactosidase